MSVRILHIATDCVGGAGSAMLRIHQSLLDLGVESRALVRYSSQIDSKTIYAINPAPRCGFWYATKLGRFIRRVLHKLNYYLSQRDFVLEQRKTVDKDICFTLPISEYKIHTHPLIEWADVIHLHWIQDFIDFPSFFENVKKPIIWTIHDMNPMFGGFHHICLRDKYMEQFGELERACYSIKKDALSKNRNVSIVALSTEMHNMLAVHEFFTGRIIHDIANSVDTTIFTLGDKQKLRCKYGIPMNSYVLLFANAQLNDTEKGLVELVRALEILNNKEITLLCVGNGKLPKTKIDIIQLPRVSTQQEMAQMYQMADMLVMPSRQEAFALTPLEAMSCGKPVVITPVSGANDLMRTFTGEIAMNFTPEAIAKAIKNAMKKEYDEKQIRNYIIDNYNLNIIGQKYNAAYKQLICSD